MFPAAVGRTMMESARPRAATMAGRLHCQRVEESPRRLLHLSACAYHALDNPRDHDDGNHPGREKRNRHADHP